MQKIEKKLQSNSAGHSHRLRGNELLRAPRFASERRPPVFAENLRTLLAAQMIETNRDTECL